MDLVEKLKEAIALAQKAKQSDLKRLLTEMQADTVRLVEESHRKNQRIAELEKTTTINQNLTLKGSAYYVIDTSGKHIEGPYCPRCLDVDNVKTRIADLGATNLECFVCRTPYPRTPVALNPDES